MKHIVESEKTIEQITTDLESAAKENKFGVLHTFDLQKTLQSKGFDFQNPCLVLEVCSPKIANEVLCGDMGLSTLLPCRISIWEESGKTKIGMASPEKLFDTFADSKELSKFAKEAEETLLKIIDAAK